MYVKLTTVPTARSWLRTSKAHAVDDLAVDGGAGVSDDGGTDDEPVDASGAVTCGRTSRRGAQLSCLAESNPQRAGATVNTRTAADDQRPPYTRTAADDQRPPDVPCRDSRADEDRGSAVDLAL